MTHTLLVVESPTKAKTLAKYLKNGYTVKASKGHVKDLPEHTLGVDVEKDFVAEYQIITGKRQIIEEIRNTAKTSKAVLLGPDPDREGEAIAWHIAEEILRDGAKGLPIHRVLFYELTKKGIEQALAHPGPLNHALYEAQQARRILDRLVGYLISPILWQKVRKGLSAGRVQSVALRLVCEREREIYAFRPQEYWTVEAVLGKGHGEETISARLVRCYGKKQCVLHTREEAQRVVAVLQGRPYVVAYITEKRQQYRPSPPFITSTLQQDASRRLRFSPKKTMQVAQQLYEGVEIADDGAIGLITYMRTDSTRLSDDAVEAARRFINLHWGPDYLPPKAHRYKKKAASQDAHEAIRPTDVFRTPELVKPYLAKDQYLLYELIWKRFVACQMSVAEVLQTSADIVPEGEEGFTLRASGSQISFPGFLSLYREASDDEASEDRTTLPHLAVGERLSLLDISASQHFTKPPPRYSEASLIKELEENGVGRPSTYAAIVSTIQERGYVFSDRKTIRPTELGFIVNDLLVVHFPDIVDISFTAQMESALDKIAQGEGSLLDLLKSFYARFHPMLTHASREIKNLRREGIPTDLACPRCGEPTSIRWFQSGEPVVACAHCRFSAEYERDERGQLRLIPPQETEKRCECCGKPMVVKKGRYGSFLACSGYPECTFTKPMTLGIPCPREECDGELVERRSKRGKIFYGCSCFPACTVTLNKKPHPRRCPQCGYPIMAYVQGRGLKGPTWVCLNRPCRYREPAQEG